VDWLIFALPVLLLVLMFSSQRKRQRSVQQLQASLQPGQQVVTTSGLFARIAELDDAVVLLEVGPGQRLRWDRRAIAAVVADDATPTMPPPSTPGASAAEGGARPADEN
jgi:preprotein translocase subunit YajC